MSDQQPKAPTPATSSGEFIRGFNAVLGFRIAEWRDGFARLEVDLTEHHLNRSGLVHGGVLATLIDAACGYTGVHPTRPGQQRRAVTLSMTTSFLGQAKDGTIASIAHRRGGGKTVYMASAEVFGPDGALIAIGEAVYRQIPDKSVA